MRAQDYIKLHQREIEAYKQEDALSLPDEFDYRSLPITTEEKELLSTLRPATLGQAARTPGVRPASVRPRQPRWCFYNTHIAGILKLTCMCISNSILKLTCARACMSERWILSSMWPCARDD
jgi:hypothetical protein